MAGIVYCLTNPAMPDLVKIGMVEINDANALKERLRTLYASGVPYPFELFYAVAVESASNIERLLHDTFSNSRVNSRREFFSAPPERVVSAMKLTGGARVALGDDGVDLIPDIDAGNRARERANARSQFIFSDANIPEGAVLTFSRDPSIKAEAVGKKRVIFNETKMSLTRAATQALEQIGDPAAQWKSLAGTHFWEYNGETLKEIRDRLEAEALDVEDEEE